VLLQLQVPGRLNEVVSYLQGENGKVTAEGQLADRVDWMKAVGEGAPQLKPAFQEMLGIVKSHESKIAELQDKIAALDAQSKGVMPDVQANGRHAGEPTQVKGPDTSAGGAHPETVPNLFEQKAGLQSALHEAKLDFVKQLVGALRENRLAADYSGLDP